MSSQDAIKDRSYVYVPLVKQGNRFVEALESQSIEGNTELFSALEAYIKRNYKSVEGQVEINGHLYLSTVLIPDQANDLCYVLADENRVPVGANLPTVEFDDVQLYIHQIRNKLNKTEGMLPDQVIDLRTQFIRPEFISLQPSETDKTRRVTWEGFLNHGRIALLGEPGSGKTTCLRRMALEFSDPEKIADQPTSIPVYLQLRDFADSSLDSEAIKRALATQQAESLSENFSTLSQAGQFLLIFDGLDEVIESNRARVTQSIRDISNQFPQNRIVVSTRKAGYNWEFPDFTHFEIQPFNLAQIKQWSWQSIHTKKSWKIFFTYLKESGDLLAIAGNPLMLSLTASMFLRQSLTPHNQATLLKHYIKALVEDWDSSRNIVRSKERWTAPHRMYPILCNLSFECSKTSRLTFSEQDVSEWRKDSIEKVPAQHLLSLVAEITGLIHEAENDKWTFKNKMIMECLAAQYLVSSTLDVEDFFTGHFSNDPWKDIWFLACGITYDANHLFDLAIQSQELGSSTKALLITQALSQDIEISHKALESCCDIIVGVLESSMDTLSISTGEVQSVGVQGVQPLWSIALSNPIPPHVINAPKGIELRRLLRHVYKARSGPAKDSLQTKLMESKIPLIRNFASWFEVEGEYIDQVIETEKEELLLIYINPESPNIKG